MNGGGIGRFAKRSLGAAPTAAAASANTTSESGSSSALPEKSKIGAPSLGTDDAAASFGNGLSLEPSIGGDGGFGGENAMFGFGGFGFQPSSGSLTPTPAPTPAPAFASGGNTGPLGGVVPGGGVKGGLSIGSGRSSGLSMFRGRPSPTTPMTDRPENVDSPANVLNPSTTPSEVEMIGVAEGSIGADKGDETVGAAEECLKPKGIEDQTTSAANRSSGLSMFRGRPSPTTVRTDRSVNSNLGANIPNPTPPEVEMTGVTEGSIGTDTVDEDDHNAEKYLNPEGVEGETASAAKSDMYHLNSPELGGKPGTLSDGRGTPRPSPAGTAPVPLPNLGEFRHNSENTESSTDTPDGRSGFVPLQEHGIAENEDVEEVRINDNAGTQDEKRLGTIITTKPNTAVQQLRKFAQHPTKPIEVDRESNPLACDVDRDLSSVDRSGVARGQEDSQRLSPLPPSAPAVTPATVKLSGMAKPAECQKDADTIADDNGKINSEFSCISSRLSFGHQTGCSEEANNISPIQPSLPAVTPATAGLSGKFQSTECSKDDDETLEDSDKGNDGFTGAPSRLSFSKYGNNSENLTTVPKDSDESEEIFGGEHMAETECNGDNVGQAEPYAASIDLSDLSFDELLASFRRDVKECQDTMEMYDTEMLQNMEYDLANHYGRALRCEAVMGDLLRNIYSAIREFQE